MLARRISVLRRTFRLGASRRLRRVAWRLSAAPSVAAASVLFPYVPGYFLLSMRHFIGRAFKII